MTQSNNERGPALEAWLARATCQLSADSAAQVRTEIAEHCDSARESAIGAGATPHDADRLSVTSLGDPKVANRHYRRVLLTSAEARMLRESNWEARAVCSRPWLKRLLMLSPIGALLAAAAFFVTGKTAVAQGLLAVSIALVFAFTAPFLPIYTPSRARVFRGLKWGALIGAFLFAFGPQGLKSAGILISCLAYLIWIEWTRESIRRKLPIARWPNQLYL
jgi:hypothetical protein